MSSCGSKSWCQQANAKTAAAGGGCARLFLNGVVRGTESSPMMELKIGALRT